MRLPREGTLALGGRREVRVVIGRLLGHADAGPNDPMASRCRLKRRPGYRSTEGDTVREHRSHCHLRHVSTYHWPPLHRKVGYLMPGRFLRFCHEIVSDGPFRSSPELGAEAGVLGFLGEKLTWRVDGVALGLSRGAQVTGYG